MPVSKIRILFLCHRNSARSQMAEGFARAKRRENVDVFSAGTAEPAPVHPAAIRVMKEAGIDIGGQGSKALDEVRGIEFDAVVTLCSNSAEACPILPGHHGHVDWNLPDPAAVQGDDETVLAAFRKSRDEIRRLVDDLFDRGYLTAMAEAAQCSNVILDNISDGIIAHDMRRRILFFNKAAEQITGYGRSEALNRDCHDVFPGNFCSGKCMFCDATVPDFEQKRQELDIVSKSGEKKRVDMTLKSLTNPAGKRVGVLASFRDITRELALARRVGEIEQFSGIIGKDEKMLEMFDLIRDLADSTVPVMIQGESGTGKELVAAAIHNEGPRANKQFVPVNCGALPESLLESELFGHVRGAFTGAVRDKKGRFEIADGGTIFLDEVGDISPTMQVKLLRVLQEGKFERVGSEKSIRVDVRVISATNKDIVKEAQSGRFREDLFYRLNVVPLYLPPLRERRNDIPLLAENILRRILGDTGKKSVSISRDAMDMMLSYDWPGNVRELQNWIQFALVKCKGDVILPKHLPPLGSVLVRSSLRGGEAARSAPAAPVLAKRRKLDMDAVRKALDQTRGNRLEAARLLGVSRATLYRFLDRAGVSE